MATQEEINAIGKATAEHLISTVFKLVLWGGLGYYIFTNIGFILGIILLPGVYILQFLKNFSPNTTEIIVANIILWFVLFVVYIAIKQHYQEKKEEREKLAAMSDEERIEYLKEKEAAHKLYLQQNEEINRNAEALKIAKKSRYQIEQEEIDTMFAKRDKNLKSLN